jgi:hypothetical protein
MQQLALFDACRLPFKPYCTDYKGDYLDIRPLKAALKRRYLQFNPPHAVNWIILDVDAPVALAGSEKPSTQMLAILDGTIPAPNFLAINPENGHAHAFYALETAVAKGDHASQKALRYVAAIEAALIRTMGADALYVGLIAKNPTHQDWRVLDLRKEPYTLGELHESLDLKGPSKSKLRREAMARGVGRNCDLFDRLRYHAYKMVELYKQDATYDQWLRYCYGKAEDFNDFAPELDAREARHIGKSVAKWTWTHYTGRMDDVAFSRKQGFKGAMGGRISAKVRAAEAEKSGESLSSKMSKISSKGISEQQPWKDLGISRAQWYRERKTSGENVSHT